MSSKASKVLGGRNRLEFGTVRPRGQIPGPRTIFLDSEVGPDDSRDGDFGLPCHSRVTELNSLGYVETQGKRSSNPGAPAPKRRTRYNQPFASASFAASDRFLQPNFWIAFER